MKTNSGARATVRTFALAVACAIAAMGTAHAIENADCLTCHSDPTLSTKMPDGSALALYVDATIFKTSVHGEADCTSCHADITELPHPAGLKKVDCGTCHEEVGAYKKSAHGQSLEKGAAGAASCNNCHGKHDIRHTSDPLSMVSPLNLPATCGKCHSDPKIVKSHIISILNPSDAYLKSGHAKAIAAGNMKAATCSACHGSHDLQKADDPTSNVNRHNIPTTCGKCHPEEMKKYDAGIHGKAMAAGIKDAPTCIDCHNEHDIEAPSEEGSTVNPTRVVRSTCPRCHDNERTMKRYGVETGRQASYMDSYHGLARAAGSKVVASCTSCHGAHDILPQDDPASTTNHANLPKTCGKCHENASANFAIGAVHIMPTNPGQKALGIVRMLYIGLITLVIGGMIGHNTLLMIRRSTIKFTHELYGTDTYRRFTTGMIIGHVVLTVAFIALSVSGFALRYPESWWAHQLFQGDAGLAARGVIHRIAALVLVAVAIANAIYLICTKAGRKELWSLMMGLKDLKDVFLNLAFIFGLRKTEPAFDRYSYIEKFEYWGMWWGTLLMIVTGFSMWFVNIFLRFLPKVALDIVALIHFYEAWLAVGTIIVWHLYYMIFDPQTYPMNWSWITGRITLDDFKERHPLEYERELAKQKEEEKP